MKPEYAPIGLVFLFVLAAVWFLCQWFIAERRRIGQEGRRVTFQDIIVGLSTNFFDTLGIGSFAPTTAIFKLRRRMRDEEIPGTLNVGHALPTIAQALVFVVVVRVDIVTLFAMISASVVGAWLGVSIVSRLPRRVIQTSMGIALLIAASLFLASNLKLLPGGGIAVGVSGASLFVAVSVNFLLGALMMLGIGLYAPCLILVSLLGMNPLAAFPIMMGSCALLMAVGGVRFVRLAAYNFGAALGLTLGGIPGVLIAAFIVKSMPIELLRWLVVAVVVYAAAMMLISAYKERLPKLSPTTT